MPNNQAKDSERHPSGLDVKENKDGTFTLEWDKEDPRWQFLNDLDEEQIVAIIQSSLESELNELNN